MSSSNKSHGAEPGLHASFCVGKAGGDPQHKKGVGIRGQMELSHGAKGFPFPINNQYIVPVASSILMSDRKGPYMVTTLYQKPQHILCKTVICHLEKAQSRRERRNCTAESVSPLSLNEFWLYTTLISWLLNWSHYPQAPMTANAVLTRWSTCMGVHTHSPEPQRSCNVVDK